MVLGERDANSGRTKVAPAAAKAIRVGPGKDNTSNLKLNVNKRQDAANALVENGRCYTRI